MPIVVVHPANSGIRTTDAMNKSHENTLAADILTEMMSIDYRPVTAAALAHQMQIDQINAQDFADVLASLISAGRIRQDKHGRLKPRGQAGTVTGTVRRITSGAAFVIPAQRTPELRGGDIYVTARDLGDAQTGDEVLVRILARRRANGQRCGIVDRIEKRATSTFVGTWSESGGQGYVQVDGGQFSSPIHVGDPGARGPRRNDKVVIEMLKFPTDRRHGEAVITKVLGRRGDPGVDTQTVIHSLGLPTEFPDDALEEARLRASHFDESIPNDRQDLTAETIVTIDPVDARDFDDAISLTQSADGLWHLGVHIADVAHFVTDGGPLDREAQRRGTSVYLPGHVIPMLPELISNGLASLQQGQVRYTKSVFIDFDPDGAVLGMSAANTAIKVECRFAYEEVMPILNQPEQHAKAVSGPVRQLLKRMYRLAMLLRRRRTERGALQMGIPEVEIDFGPDGTVTGAHERHHDESHEIIEEFMLAANIAVATMLNAKRVPFLRRVHGDPDVLKMTSFQQFCQGLGLTLHKPQSRTDLQELIQKVAGTPVERAVNFALLRSMKQAEYSPEVSGHYALAEEQYCHFTSPIRRYPDLTIHRLLDQVIRNKPRSSPALEQLFQLGKHCSATERRAERAERELIRIRLLRFMAKRVGEEMDALITGVEGFGLFCQGIDIPAEGMLHVSAFANDFLEFDPVARTLTGTQSRQQFRLGDRIRVMIAAVDIDRRQLDLLPARTHSKPRTSQRLPFPAAGRKPGPPAESTDQHSARRKPKHRGKSPANAKKKRSKKRR